MDWSVAKKTAKEMLDACEKAYKADGDSMTTVATMLLFVCSMELFFREAGDEIKRPDNLQQFYGWAGDCLNSMKALYSQKPEKPD